MAELILRTAEMTRHPWPAGILIQGGTSGLVISRDGSPSYTTAFVEAFPDTFIRGEGATVADAEDAAWAQYTRNQACPGHEMEARGYQNGAGFCRHCNLFKTGVFTAEDLGLSCAVCGAWANWASAGGLSFCRDHAPTRTESHLMDAAAHTSRGFLETLISHLSPDET